MLKSFEKIKLMQSHKQIKCVYVIVKNMMQNIMIQFGSDNNIYNTKQKQCSRFYTRKIANKKKKDKKVGLLLALCFDKVYFVIVTIVLFILARKNLYFYFVHDCGISCVCFQTCLLWVILIIISVTCSIIIILK